MDTKWLRNSFVYLIIMVAILAVFFTIFLFCRLYHWWWDWMPKYVFFAIIGAIAIVLVLGFKRVRGRLTEGNAA